MRLAAVSCAVIGAAVLAGGCAQSGYDANKLQREMRNAGLSSDQAQCVTDRMESTFDVNVLASHSEPTAKELATARTLIEQCGVTLPPP